ncbi:acetamidase/formamidase family protein [Cryobacterium sp. Y57]|uniref:acetamidase/formamidase family protein n=1 Tax=Cryobacterium sp. Y57 TaxID=2048287 RepID=UPI000CE353F3|nr:acetamidase/formamidase family protein [Cryobacterium sp. Y57]
MGEFIEFESDEDADRSKLVYTFGGVEPVLSIRPGTVIRATTLDAFGGVLNSIDKLPSQVCDSRYLNPQTGPFFLEGAELGDTLAVHFIQIEPRYKWGVSASIPFFGGLTSTPETAMLQEALPEMTWIYELDKVNRLVRYEARESKFGLDLPMDPMHGTVGVAPPLREVRSSLAPGCWGGNMDTPEMRVGATCYLGVNVEGALLSFGDGHARQSEGETCGVAVECAMDSVIVVDLIKHMQTPWPRLETDEYLMTTGSSKPMEDAFRVAHVEMVRWMSELLEISTMDAYQLVTQTVLTPVANACDKAYTVVCKMPKAFLKNVVAMKGMHEKLKKTTW